MTSYSIKAPKRAVGAIGLPASKSIANRALILGAMCGVVEFANMADCDDTKALRNGLRGGAGGNVNVGAAGTAMRFLTAYYACQEGAVCQIDGSERMRQRPIAKLVESLRGCGAEIEYLGAEGYPPLKITGKKLKASKITISGDTSSQYISAMLMISPKIEGCREIEIAGDIVSRPYIEMTLAMMRQFGVEAKWEGNKVLIPENAEYKCDSFVIEADWSAASYWYEIAALLPGSEIELRGLSEHSIQGDSAVARMFGQFGVKSEWQSDGSLRLTSAKTDVKEVEMSLESTPDLAQTIIATACGTGCKKMAIDGLQTLRIKETDRVAAMQKELGKLGYMLTAEGAGKMSGVGTADILSTQIDTYSDHRMAMAIAPLAARHNGLTINNPEVVGKSYSSYWDDLRKVGFEVMAIGETGKN